MAANGLTTSEVVVVGAGAVGSAVAYYLAEAGVRTVLLEREAIGSGASTHATGSFSLLGADFLDREHLELGVLSYRLTRDLVPRLEELSGIQTLYQRRPSLRLALDEQEEGYIRDRPAWHEALVPARWIDGDEVRRIEPRLSPEVRGAAFEDESAQLDSGRFTLALATAAERLGVTILQRRATGLERAGGRVTGVVHQGGAIACDAIVLAMGPWAAAASAWLDFAVPITWLWGERLLLRFDQPPLATLISSPKRGHMISRLDGLLSVGSTAGRDFDDQRQYVAAVSDDEPLLATPTEAALLEILQRAIEVLPALEDASVVQQLAGYRPLSPDRRPLIGPVPGWDGAYLATGHATKGIHLAAATGRVVADLTTTGRTDLDVALESFSPARFGAVAAGAAGVEQPGAMRMADD
jgi:glycine oxidase